MSEPFVSVVTPVYNDEPYLEECIRSVLAQSHQDFEYIICNNHSKDRSGEIAADYAAKDSRIRVVSPPEFSPQAKNFNFALSQIDGRAKYCKMLLSDDWMYPQCLQQMIEVAESNPRIVLVSAYRLIGDRPDCFGVPVERSSFSGKEACRWQLLGTCYPFGSQSTVMYGAEAVRKRAPSFFPENRFFMDVDIAFRLLGRWRLRLRAPGSHLQSLSARYRHRCCEPFQLVAAVALPDGGAVRPDVLSPEEFKKRYNEVTTEMYQGLGEQWLKDIVRRKKKNGFWEFQRQHLGDIGVEIRPALLAKGVVTAGLNLVGSLSTLAKKVRNETTKTRAS